MSIRRRKFFRKAEAEPMSSLTNLSDIMLVFAVSVMLLALARWNIDLGGIPLVKLNPEDLLLVDDLETLRQENESFGEYTDQAERVYVDPKTGQMFILK